jgi:hypothetical protein
MSSRTCLHRLSRGAAGHASHAEVSPIAATEIAAQLDVSWPTVNRELV